MPEYRRRFLQKIVFALLPAIALAGAAAASPVSAAPILASPAFAGSLPAMAGSVAERPDLLIPAQYYGERPRYRRRCHLERRRVLVRDRYGRPRERVGTREVCR